MSAPVRQRPWIAALACLALAVGCEGPTMIVGEPLAADAGRTKDARPHEGTRDAQSDGPRDGRKCDWACLPGFRCWREVCPEDCGEWRGDRRCPSFCDDTPVPCVPDVPDEPDRSPSLRL